LLVTDHIRKKAKSGEQIGLTVVVQGAQSPSGGSLSPAEATVSAVLGQPSSSPITPPGTGPFPSTPAGFPGTTVTPGSITSLFPVVTPSPTPTPNATRHENRGVAKATSTASSLPLDPRLIGGQLAGLAVLAAAITMVVARLSLRTPQLASAPQSGSTVAAAPPPQPGSADAKTDSSDAGNISEDSST